MTWWERCSRQIDLYHFRVCLMFMLTILGLCMEGMVWRFICQEILYARWFVFESSSLDMHSLYSTMFAW